MPDEVPDLPEPHDHTVVTTPEQLAALNSRLRMRILAVCKEPRSVRETAELLDVPITRLYHHVNLLRDAGLIAVVEVRKSGARLEKIYRVTGRVIKADPESLGLLPDQKAAATAMVSVVLEPTRAEAEAAVRAHLQGGGQRYYLGRDQAMLTDADASELINRLADFVADYLTDRNAGDDPEALPFAFTYALTRTDLV